MTKLSVNINKIATIRNARGGNLPDLVGVARDVIDWGADGITVHPRPDERHIKRSDVYALFQMIRDVNEKRDDGKQIEFNIEGNPSDLFLELIREVRPNQCTLVPDPPHVITSNAGWQLYENQALLSDVTGELKALEVRTSLFIDPLDLDESEIESILKIGPDRVEFYTEAYARAFEKGEQGDILEKYSLKAVQLFDLGIKLNAGHDLNLKNLGELLKKVPVIEEVSIGHALVCDALYLGLEETINRYLEIVK